MKNKEKENAVKVGNKGMEITILSEMVPRREVGAQDNLCVSVPQSEKEQTGEAMTTVLERLVGAVDSVMGKRGHGGRVVTLSPPTYEVGVRFMALPQVGKLVVACHWSAVYSTEF